MIISNSHLLNVGNASYATLPNIQSKRNLPSNNTLYSNAIAKSPELGTLQAYYLNKKPSFGRLAIEHLQNGAYVDKAKNVFFRLFTFADVEKVFVDIKGKGVHELEKAENGIFQTKLGSSLAKAGDKYRFKIVRNGKESFCRDPYAMKCNSVLDDFAEIYDHNAYNWTDKAWRTGKDKRRLSRRSAQNGLLPLSKVRIYEANIATLTQPGTFKAAKAKIDEIAANKIFNTVHIMPVESTYSFNWGYDGVAKFAPQKTMGGPNALKKFIDHCHSKGINVIMDIVPNHIGPDGNKLREAGPYVSTTHGGPFGDVFNFEDDPQNNKYVRDYVTNMCLNWLGNYHCDGIRLDLTKEMKSDFTMKQIAMEVHYHHPDAILIAEDARNNMQKLIEPLSEEEEAVGLSEAEHAKRIGRVDRNDPDLLNKLGFDSEWDFVYQHNLLDVLYGLKPVSSIRDIQIFSGPRLKYPMSHDEIGNMDGTRLITKLVSRELDLFSRTEGQSDAQRGQRAAQAAQTILVAKVLGKYDKFSEAERLKFLASNYIHGDIAPDELNNILNRAIAQHKLALGFTFTTPGPKMIFQGDESGSLSLFKFFRELSQQLKDTDEKILIAEKGYAPGVPAFLDSKLNSINYSKKYHSTMKKIKQYTKDLAALIDRNSALESGYTVSTIEHDISGVHAVHLRGKDGKEVFVVSNFKDTPYLNNYALTMPQGKWKEVINSNDVKYAGDGQYMNKGRIVSGSETKSISIPRNALLIFEKVA